jgi:hypothetical protein
MKVTPLQKEMKTKYTDIQTKHYTSIKPIHTQNNKKTACKQTTIDTYRHTSKRNENK